MLKHLTIISLVGLTMVSCGRQESDKATGFSLAVSIPPQKAVLDYLTGDSLDVVTAIAAEANPESWEPSINDFVSLNDAAVYFTTGQLPFESTIVSSLDKGVEIVDSSEGIDLVYGTHNHNHGDADNESNSVADPHVWTSISGLRVIAANMTETLCRLDGVYAPKYRNNLQRFNHRLDSIDSTVRSKLEYAPSHSFLIWHPSLSYFARDYGLNQIALGEENKEVSVTQMRDKIDRAHASQCKTMFIQSNYDARQAGNVASQLGLIPIAINPVAYDWESQFNIIADAIAR